MNDAFVETQAAGVGCSGEHRRRDCGGDGCDSPINCCTAVRPTSMKRKWRCEYLQAYKSEVNAPELTATGRPDPLGPV